MKKVTATVLACAMAASMTACGSAAAVTSSEASSTATAVSSEVSSTAIESVAASSEFTEEELINHGVVSVDDMENMTEFIDFVSKYDKSAKASTGRSHGVGESLVQINFGNGAISAGVSVIGFTEDDPLLAEAKETGTYTWSVNGEEIITEVKSVRKNYTLEIYSLPANVAIDTDVIFSDDQQAEIIAKFNELFAE